MAVSAVLRPGAVTVSPGRTARCALYIRNTGQVVDQFVFSLVGDVDGWSTLRPDKVNLLPNEEAVVDVIFSPPMTYEVLAGEHPFAIRVVSREDSEGSLVYEGSTTVDEFVQLNAEIVPQNSRGRIRGKHTLVVDNVGNFPLGLEVRPTDPDALLNFRVRPQAPLTEPGTANMIKVRPRPVKRFWRGPDRRIPFTVEVVPETGKTLSVAAALNQRAMLPRRLLLLLALLLVLAIIALLVVSNLLQKQPVSMAGPSPEEPSASSTSATSSAPSSVVPISPISPAGGAAQGNGQVQAQGTGTGTGAGSVPTSANFSIQANAYPGSASTPQLFSYVIPEGETERLVSVAFNGSPTGTGSVQVLLDSTVLASFDLAHIQNVTYQFPTQPVATTGQHVTLAVSCTGTSVCSTTGAFTTAAAT